MAKLCDEGETEILEELCADQVLYLGLYTDASEPAESAVLTDLTEVTGGGYARKTLAAGIAGDPNWTVAGDLASRPQEEWIFSAGVGSVYGYFLATTVDDSGRLVAVEHFSNGPYIDPAKVRLTPKLRAS